MHTSHSTTTPPPPLDASGRTIMLGAIDAGSNALRAAVAISRSDGKPVILSRMRVPVRLGERAFVEGRLSPGLIAEAAEAFAGFRRMFDSFGVERYRAVATSAVREADNRDVLLEVIRDTAGLDLQPIDGREEARLLRQAVTCCLGKDRQPDLIADLGGGSLELSALYRGELVHATTLPVGTVRLMTQLGWRGAISLDQATAQRDALRARLRQQIASQPRKPERVVLAGGNAKALAKAYPAEVGGRLPHVDLAAIARDLPALLGASVPERMARFGVSRDRAEVMAIAALIFVSLGEWLGVEHAMVPGLGVLDGLLGDLAVLGMPWHVAA